MELLINATLLCFAAHGIEECRISLCSLQKMMRIWYAFLEIVPVIQIGLECVILKTK